MSGRRLTKRVLDRRLWGETPFVLLDVGCSGGIDARWSIFGDRLSAVGFDPLVAEIDRLNAADTAAGVRYEAAFVGCHTFDVLFPPDLRNDRIAARSNDPFSRVSAFAAMRRMQTSYVQEVFNAGAPIVFADRRVELDDVVPPDERPRVALVKIDTDGHDIEVLLGSDQIMRAGGALGFSIEVQLHGSTHDYANTFANIDRLMRQHGFTLFDLDVHRYSRTALPAPFALDLAAQTMSGQHLWGEALYFRDLGDPDYERMWAPYAITRERVVKLACLFELFGLRDCAAELLVNRPQLLEPGVRADLLDQLVSGEPGSYDAAVRAFDEDFTSLYPSRIRARDAADVTPEPASSPVAEAAPAGETVEGAAASAEETQELRRRVTKLKTRVRELRKRVQARDERLAQLDARLKASSDKRRLGH